MARFEQLLTSLYLQAQSALVEILPSHITGFVRIMENLKSRGVLHVEFHFPGLESLGISIKVMESRGISIKVMESLGISMKFIENHGI